MENLFDKDWIDYNVSMPNALFKVFKDIYEREVIRFFLANNYLTTKFKKAIPYSSREIAEYIGAGHTKVSESLNSLSSKGYITKVSEKRGNIAATYILTLKVKTEIDVMSEDEINKTVSATRTQNRESVRHTDTSVRHTDTNFEELNDAQRPNPCIDGASGVDTSSQEKTHLILNKEIYNIECEPTSRKDTSKKKHTAKEVLEYLNKKTNKKFKPTDANLDLILKLLKLYSQDDLRSVVDIKTEEWMDDEKMSKYLRPSTLFNANKFDDYLNQGVGVKGRAKQAEQEILEIFRKAKREAENAKIQ